MQQTGIASTKWSEQQDHVSGFTIIEVMLALALLVLLAAPLTQWVDANFKLSLANSEQERAYRKLSNFVELLYSGAWSDLLAEAKTIGDSVEIHEDAYTFRLGYIEDYPLFGDGRAGLEQIRVSLVWKDIWGREKCHEVTLLRARGP